MVDVLVYIALGASLLSLGSLIVLARYLPVLRRASHAYVDSSDLISGMMKELNARASLQDRRLADSQVKLDVLEDRWLRTGWGSFQTPIPYPPPTTNSNSTIHESDTVMIPRQSKPVWSTVRLKAHGESVNQSDLRTPSKVEALVMKNLVGRRMTAPEVKGVLGSSREHAARIMKSLADKGLVVRDTSKKPFSYVLSDVGRDMVTGNLAVGL